MLGIRTGADFRAFLHVFLPSLATAAVGAGMLSDNAAALWVALAAALLDPALSAINSTGFRQALYVVLGAANGVLIGIFGLYTNSQAAPWWALVPVLIGGGIAAANTPTSTDASVPPRAAA